MSVVVSNGDSSNRMRIGSHVFTTSVHYKSQQIAGLGWAVLTNQLCNAQRSCHLLFTHRRFIAIHAESGAEL